MLARARFELFQAGGDEVDAFAVLVSVEVLRHEQKEKLRVLRRPGAIDGLEVFQFWRRPHGR